MSYNGNNSGEGGNMWSSGSRGGSRGGYSRSGYGDNDGGARGGGSYHGSFGNNNSRRGGYGFRRPNQDGGSVEILTDAVFIQNLPKTITQDELNDVFSTVGPIKIDDRSGGPKIWIYKDRETNEPNGRATVTYEDDESANKAIATFNDQHIESIDAVVRVQLAQRRPRTDNNDRGGGRGGYRGGRSNWDDNRNSRQGFNSGGGDRWDSPREGFSGGRGGGGGGGFRGNSGDSFRKDDDQGGSYRGGRGGGAYRGASRGNSGSSNYSPY